MEYYIKSLQISGKMQVVISVVALPLPPPPPSLSCDISSLNYYFFSVGLAKFHIETICKPVANGCLHTGSKNIFCWVPDNHSLPWRTGAYQNHFLHRWQQDSQSQSIIMPLYRDIPRCSKLKSELWRRLSFCEMARGNHEAIYHLHHKQSQHFCDMH